MIKKLHFQLLILLTCNILISQEFQTNHNLQITVKKFENIKGELRVCLIDKKEDFLKPYCINGKVVSVTNDSVSLEIVNLKTGIYSISVFHDENSNGILDTKGLFGIPSEPYGFSNNPNTRFGPPGFEKCTFLINKEKQISIELH